MDTGMTDTFTTVANWPGLERTALNTPLPVQLAFTMMPHADMATTFPTTADAVLATLAGLVVTSK
jgi:hypothetical protein